MGRLAILGLFLTIVTSARAQDVNEQTEKAVKDAVKKVGPSVVQIITSGGTDLVVTAPKGPAFRKALAPTTGVIVSADGYVITSSFNFINNPTNILVAVPGQAEPFVAKRVANDKSRMLALLKIESKEKLPVPAFVPLAEIHEGQWAIALGRTLDTKRDKPASVSVGVISAKGRIWGKALQTDCKVSPVNYGGPIVDVTGRVQGILVPADPKGDDATAGFEWYDSGIGFAIPMEEVLAALPRLAAGQDLKRGMLGVRMKSADIYGVAPEIEEVLKDSAAARAGLQKGDVIVEIQGQKIVRMAQILHLLGARYEGDKIALTYRRGKDLVNIKEMELAGTTPSVANGFLGILPMRDDPSLGVAVRYVFAGSPAEKAGLKPGDRIVKFGTGKELTAFTGEKSGRAQFFDFLNTQPPGNNIQLEVKHADGKTETVAATLAALPGTSVTEEKVIPDTLPEEASFKKAQEPRETTLEIKPAKVDKPAAPAKIETGLLKRTTPDGEHTYYLFVPDDYDANVAYAVLLWLHPPGKNQEADIESVVELWADHCAEQHVLLVAPLSENESGWITSEAEYVVASVRDVLGNYSVDRQRVVAHGLGIGGQMAIHLGFNQRDLFRGVVATGSLATQLKDNQPNQRLSFYLAGGELDPILKSMADSRARLVEKKYSVVLRQIPGRGREYFEEAQVREVIRWLDSLDRQ